MLESYSVELDIEDKGSEICKEKERHRGEG